MAARFSSGDELEAASDSLHRRAHARATGSDPASNSSVSGRSRLSRSRDFDTVYKKGRSAASRSLVVYTFRHSEEAGDVRLGLAVPRRVGDAVTRNRVKRKLREAFADASGGLEVAHDVVIVGRPGVAETLEREDHNWLIEELRSLINQTLTRSEAVS